MLINSFMIPGCIMNGMGLEAWACAFLCFRARNKIVCSSGVHLLPFLALAISKASLNSGLSMEHVCCHVFPPACAFLSGLGNIPVTEIGGSPFPHGGVILNVGRCPASGVAWGLTAGDDADASIIGICSSTGTDIPALSGKKPHNWWKGERPGPSSFSSWICWTWPLILNQRNWTSPLDWLVFFCPVFAGQQAPFGDPWAWLQDQ